MTLPENRSLRVPPSRVSRSTELGNKRHPVRFSSAA